MARGDHLFFYRGGLMYSHHGICCGDGTVIHYESSLWSKLAGAAASHRPPTVRRVERHEFSLGSEIHVRPYAVCDDPDLVMARAWSRLGEADYNIFANNCEHFAVWCKTGQAHSTQVQAHRRAAQAVIHQTPIALQLLRKAAQLQSRRYVWASTGAVAASIYFGNYLAGRLRERALRRS